MLLKDVEERRKKWMDLCDQYCPSAGRPGSKADGPSATDAGSEGAGGEKGDDGRKTERKITMPQAALAFAFLPSAVTHIAVGVGRYIKYFWAAPFAASWTWGAAAILNVGMDVAQLRLKSL